jgi:spore germination protein YaaH
MRRAVAVIASAVLAAALVPAASAPAAKRCAGQSPTGLSFLPTPGATAGVLSWSHPRRSRGVRRYRVLRNGRVVGQTLRRAMRVRTKPGRTYVFTVRLVSASGRVSACSGRLVRNMRHRTPKAPRDLVASGVSDTGAKLTWSASRAGDRPLRGYRIFRDGMTLRQVKGRSIRVALAPRRNYVFTVAAVDGAGYLGPASKAVTIKTGHRPPSVPTGLTVTNVGESSLDVAWRASKPATGRIAGYRVYRDGTLLRQVGSTSMGITGLAAAQRYELTVAAVDSLGYLSATSEPVAATTAVPAPTEGGVHAYLLASTGQSFEDLQAHYRQIGTVYPTYFECAPDGSVAGNDDPLVTRWAQMRGIKVMPRLDCQSATRQHLILTDPGVRAGVLARVSELVQQAGYDGINIDFESGAPTDRAALTSFVTELAAIMHGQGKLVSIAVSPKASDVTTGRPGIFDYPALSAAVDTVFVMNWGKHWSTSAPGAIADLPWATTVANYVASMPDKSKFVLGTDLYGFDWAAGGGAANPATPIEYADVQNLIAAVGATPAFDAVAGAPHFSYTDSQGVGHDVWYTDAATVAQHVRLARDRGLGIGFWRLGREDPSVWDDPLLAPGIAWP